MSQLLPPEDQTALPGYYMRFVPASGVKALMFRTGKALQVRELNESIQSIHDRITGITSAIFADGDIAKGLELVRLVDDPDGFALQIGSGSVYVQGFIYQMDLVKINVPLDLKVALGIRLNTAIITEQQDDTLLDPAQGTSNFDNPGAMRLVQSVVWGWVADDGTTDGGTGTFFPVYTIDNGVPIMRNPPPAFDAVVSEIAKYDYQSFKNYVGTGLGVTFMDSIGGSYHFNVDSGSANINGFMRQRVTSTRLIWAEDFDPKASNNEPHIFNPGGDGLGHLPLNKTPLAAVQGLVGTKPKTETVTRGSFSGGNDELSETSVLNVVSVVQGGTTFIPGTDYIVSGDTINWSPLGAEPAPGSTYVVSYQYEDAVTPVSTSATEVVVSGLVPGTYVNINYTWKLPRVDLVTMDGDGTLHRIEGQSQISNPAPKQCPANHVPLATVALDWVNDPVVTDIRDLTVPVSDLNEMKRQIAALFDLSAEQRLLLATIISDPTSNHGIFTDSFNNDNMRDAGIAQTAATVDGVLTLPFDAAVYVPDNAGNVDSLTTLPFTLETAISQEDATACMRINPYDAFDPIPARVTLNPSVDQWIDQGSPDYTSKIAHSFVETWAPLTSRQYYSDVRVTTSVSFKKVGLVVQSASFMRQTVVAFQITGFGPGEALSSIHFDNLDVTHSINLSTYGADSHGVVNGQFQVPPNVTLGAKTVAFVGAGGSTAQGTYVGQGQIDHNLLQQVNTTVKTHIDPLAQTFTLIDSDRILAGVALKFCALGSASNLVYVQIRETQVGIPTDTILAEGRISPGSITLNTWQNVLFDTPFYALVNHQYAIVVLTDDGHHAISIARLGDFVTSGNGPRVGWVTAQPYQIGTLLASSDAQSWLPVPDADMTFKLLACKFTSNTAVVPLGKFSGVNVTDLQAMATVLRPSADCTLDFLLTEITSGQQFRTPENRALRLDDRISDNFQVDVELAGTSLLSPMLYPLMQWLAGNMQNAATYYGRSMPADVTFDATVTFDVQSTGSASCQPFVASQKFVSGVPVQDDNGDYVAEYLALTLQSSTPVGDGWVTNTYGISGAKGVGLNRTTAVYLTLAGSPKFRIYVRNLRMIVK